MYYLKVAASGNYPEVTVTEDQYNEIITSRSILTSAFEIEEKFLIVSQNYIDFEKSILMSACDHMLQSKLTYHDMFETRMILSTKIMNLLTSTKLYYDSVSSSVKRCLPKENPSLLVDNVKNLFSAEYDSNISYL